jgi:hypothetical protein
MPTVVAFKWHPQRQWTLLLTNKIQKLLEKIPATPPRRRIIQAKNQENRLVQWQEIKISARILLLLLLLPLWLLLSMLTLTWLALLRMFHSSRLGQQVCSALLPLKTPGRVELRRTTARKTGSSPKALENRLQQALQWRPQQWRLQLTAQPQPRWLLLSRLLGEVIMEDVDAAMDVDAVVMDVDTDEEMPHEVEAMEGAVDAAMVPVVPTLVSLKDAPPISSLHRHPSSRFFQVLLLMQLLLLLLPLHPW